MTTTTKEQVARALSFLISAPNYAVLTNEMTRIIEAWDTHPLVYSGHLALLNPLLDVGLKSRDAFERLVVLADGYRQKFPAARRVDYQRALMRERRARLAKAVALHEAMTGAKLSPPKRKAFVEDTQRRWRDARAAHIARKGALSWKRRNHAVNEFWEAIDIQLDDGLSTYHRQQARR